MNHILINERAMTTALTALLGVDRMNVVKDLYRLLDNTETAAYQEGYKAGDEDGTQDGFHRGYDAGYEQAQAVMYGTDQPIIMPPLHGAAAALEPHETEQAPTPPADSPF